jgi:hypothetical protein
MEQRIIAIYCLVDEMVKQSGLKDDVRAVISNAEVLTMGYLAVSDFNGNYRKAHQYFNASRWFKAIDYSRFIRRLNVLQKVIEEIFSSLSALFSRVNPMQIYAIDSFPVEL